MKEPRRLGTAALFVLGLIGASAAGASASERDAERPDGADHAVFVQSNNPAGNQILAYHRGDNGTLTPAGHYDTGGLGGTAASAPVDPLAAPCWITSAKGTYYVANAGSAMLSGYRISRTGQLSLVTPSGVVATTGAGPIDMAVSRDGEFLYVQDGAAGTVDEFRVNRDGTLTKVGTLTGLPQFNAGGMEGLVAV